MEKSDTEGREDLSQSSKKEFSSAVNKQKGRVSKKLVQETSFISSEQKKSWNDEGFILLKGFCSEKFCDDLNQEVIEIIHSIIKEEDGFSHAYAGNGHLAIREMKPNKGAINIEDEISKLFRIHSTGIFKDFIFRQDLLDILEDLLGSNID